MILFEGVDSIHCRTSNSWFLKIFDWKVLQIHLDQSRPQWLISRKKHGGQGSHKCRVLSPGKWGSWRLGKIHLNTTGVTSSKGIEMNHGNKYKWQLSNHIGRCLIFVQIYGSLYNHFGIWEGSFRLLHAGFDVSPAKPRVFARSFNLWTPQTFAPKTPSSCRPSFPVVYPKITCLTKHVPVLWIGWGIRTGDCQRWDLISCMQITQESPDNFTEILVKFINLVYSVQNTEI